MAQYGADPDQLRSLSKTVAKAADHLSQLASQVTSQLGATRWQGPDADRFRAQWNSASIKSLRAATQDLHTASDALQRNAREQDQASAAAGGPIAATGSHAADISQVADVGAPVVTEDGIYEGLSMASGSKGVVDDLATLHDASIGVADVAHAGLGSDLLGAGGVALDAKDLQGRLKGIADGNMGDFLGGLVDVGAGAISVGGMVAPEAAVPLSLADLGATALGDAFEHIGEGKD